MLQCVHIFYILSPFFVLYTLQMKYGIWFVHLEKLINLLRNYNKNTSQLVIRIFWKLHTFIMHWLWIRSISKCSYRSVSRTSHVKDEFYFFKWWIFVTFRYIHTNHKCDHTDHLICVTNLTLRQWLSLVLDKRYDLWDRYFGRIFWFEMLHRTTQYHPYQLSSQFLCHQLHHANQHFETSYHTPLYCIQ
jgi:hypothetical protein